MARAFDSYAGIRQTLGNRQDGDVLLRPGGGTEKALRRRLVERGKGPLCRRPRPGRRPRPPGRHLERRLPALLRLHPGRPAARARRSGASSTRSPRASRSSRTSPRSSIATAQDEAAYARILRPHGPGQGAPRIPRGPVRRGRGGRDRPHGRPARCHGAHGRDALRAHVRRRRGPSCAASRSSTASSTSVTTARLSTTLTRPIGRVNSFGGRVFEGRMGRN
ncbi:MAG: hypothetical protein M0C28_13810 [Candidatus Moduliflexus flocculans]|nr:hypothetical protein [Candidatus Moduliflexus flocculans]